LGKYTPKGVIIPKYFLACSVKGIDKKAFCMSTIQKYLNLLALSKKFFEEARGEFLFFIKALIRR